MELLRQGHASTQQHSHQRRTLHCCKGLGSSTVTAPWSQPASPWQAGYADKAKGFLHKNLDSLDKRMEQWNQPRGAQGGSYSSGQMGPTDPMVNAVGAAPAGNVSAASQQVGLSGPALM